MGQPGSKLWTTIGISRRAPESRFAATGRLCRRGKGELGRSANKEIAMLRATFALVSAVVLNVAYSQAQNEKPTRSLEEDKKVLTASKWQNEKPEAAWNKLSDNFKSQLDWKPWKKVELEIMKLGDSTDPQGCTHRVQPSFLKPDDEKICFGFTSVEIREEKGKRFLVMTNLDKVAYKIEYEFKGGKLQMRGSFLHREPSSGAIFMPEVFDGEYIAVPLPNSAGKEKRTHTSDDGNQSRK
jgi:hypothetical protein